MGTLARNERAVAFVAGCAVLLLVSCLDQESGEADRGASLVQVTAIKVHKEAFQESIPLLAKVEAHARSELFPMQEGIISYPERFRAGLTDGAEIEAGETLAYIRNRTLEANIEEASLQLEAAEKDHARMLEQVKHGLVSRKDADEALLKLRLAKQRVKRQQEEKRVRGLVLAPAKGRLRVTKTVLPGTEVSSSTRLAELLVGGPLFVKGVAAVSQAKKLYIGLGVLFQQGSGGTSIGTGRVSAVSPLVSEAGTVDVSAWVDESDSLPLPGEGVMMLVQMPPIEGLPIPEEAVVYRGETPCVFTLRRSIRLANRYRASQAVIRTGPRSQGRILVYEGLKEGDLVAVKGASLLGRWTVVTLADDRPKPTK